MQFRALTAPSLLLAAALACAHSWVLAADEDEEIEEISVVGTRSQERSASDLAVPVDILDASELTRQGESRMDSMLAKIAPSINVSQEPISDAATLVRPASMRGLSADSTLVLVNGKRRHRSSIITFLADGGSEGSHPVDLAAIPASALERIEVLRDGAAAQYGSDAVAGILNFVLKDDAEGGSLDARWGRYYQGDGEAMTVAANVGLPLTADGFLNLSGEYRESDPTSRSVQRGDAQALIDAGNPHVRTPAAQVWGSPEIEDDYKLFANAGLGLADAHEAYAFGSYAERTVEGGFFYRNPHTRGGIFAHPSEPGSQVLVVDHARLDGVSCPDLDIVNGLVDPDDLAAIAAAPDCFAFNQRFPGGFTPQFGGDIEDSSLAFGLRGEIFEDLSYDVSFVTGRHEVEFFMKNTINPQLAEQELDIPTVYTPGGYVEDDWVVNLDFTLQIDAKGLHAPLNVGFGLELREEEYEIEPGEQNSWFIDYIYSGTDDPGNAARVGAEFDEATVNLFEISCNEYGDFVEQIADGHVVLKYPELGIGSNGFPGFRPDPCRPNKNDRSTFAAYVDFEADVSEDLLVGLAVRHEDPENFDATLDGKVSARYQATDAFALRGSFGSGFRVPTVGQANVRNVSTTFADGRLTDELTLPPTDPILVGIAEPLEAEESVSGGLGVVFNVGDLDVTIDYYHIEVDDRISLASAASLDCLLARKVNTEAGTFDCVALEQDNRYTATLQDDPTVVRTFGHALRKQDEDGDSADGSVALTGAERELLDRTLRERESLRPSVPAIDSVSQVRYFTNDFDTVTEGFDIVASYPAELFGGTTQFTFTGNYNRTEVKRHSAIISDLTKQQIEEGAPKIRWSLTADHRHGPWRILGRLRYYGTQIDYHALNAAWLQRVDAQYLTDLEISYDFTDRISLTFGAENLFDEEADLNPFATALGARHPESIVYDSNGGFYYLKAALSF